MTRTARRALGAIVAVLAAASPAGAETPRLTDLRIVPYEAEGWHAENDFMLEWAGPGGGYREPPVAAVHLRLRDSHGVERLLETFSPWPGGPLEHIHVPDGPGRYTAEVWLEGEPGETGSTANVPLLFDDVQPAPTRPLVPEGWINGEAAAIVRMERPPAPWPVSGIRGYAVAVDDTPGSAPCAGATRCTAAETDLRGGAGDDTISLGQLQEGAHVVSAVAVSGSGMRSAEVVSAIVRVDAHDPEVSLEAPAGWVNGPAAVVAVATDVESGMTAGGPGGPRTAIAVDGGIPHAEPGPISTAVVAGEGTHRVSSYARDAAGNFSEEMPRSAVVRIDETPPRVAFAVSQDPSEPERIEATVADSLSGPDPSRGSIALRPAGTRERFKALPTAVARGRLTALWDSDAFPAGAYEFRATGYDAAGSPTVSERRGDGKPMILQNPVKAPTRIEAGFGGRTLSWQRCTREGSRRRCRHATIRPYGDRPARWTVPYGRSVAYSGRLAGAAQAGLPIEIVEVFAAGAVPPRRATVVHTEADGTFAVRLVPGPDRHVEAVFAGNRTLTRAAGGGVELRTQAGVRLAASTANARIGGAPVVFSGRLSSLGATIPAEGRGIELQFRYPGSDWSAFRSVQTDARGRFRFAYAFSDDDSRGVRFQFRAHVAAQSGWPYEPATSRPIFVTGR